MRLDALQIYYIKYTNSVGSRRKKWRRERRINIEMFISQGDYIWIEPISGREFDVAIGARVISAEGRRIQVKDDDNKVMESYTKKNVARLSRE